MVPTIPMSPPRGELAIEAVDLWKSYGQAPVLARVTLQVQSGSVFALLGPNGAGKTTVVRILATLLRPDAGHARVAGFDVLRERHQVRRRISLTGQYAALDALQTGEENLFMMAKLSGVSRPRTRTSELLEQFDLVASGRRRVATYSGGMRRRLDLAASLVRSPTVIFLDEPTTGLDLRSRQAMWQLVTTLAAAGVTVFLTTQYLEEADQLADRIAVLDGGRIVAEGTPAELKQQIGGQRLDLTLASAADFQVAIERLGPRVRERDASRLEIGAATDGTAVQIREILDDIDPERSRVLSFTVHRPTLDDVFLALTRHHAGTTQIKEAIGA